MRVHQVQFLVATLKVQYFGWPFRQDKLALRANVARNFIQKRNKEYFQYVLWEHIFSIVKRFCYYIPRNKMANFGQKWLFAIFVVFAFVTHHHKRLWQAKARITSFLQAKVYLTLSLSVPLLSNPSLSRFLSVYLFLFLYLCFYLVL